MMSVEKQVENTIHGDVEEPLVRDDNTDVDITVSKEENPTSTDDEVHLPEVEYEETVGEISLSTLATDWFRGLTAKEKAGAITFSDGAFLGTFLAFASPWSTATAATEGDAGLVRDVDAQMGWDKLVSLTEFESKYEEIDRSMMNTPLLGNRKACNAGRSREQSVARKSCANELDSDREEIDTETGHLSLERVLSAHELLVPPIGDVKHVDEAHRHLQCKGFFDHVAVIFPSAFRHISGSVESHPRVTMLSSYLVTTSDDENLLAFPCLSHFDSFDARDNPINCVRLLYRLSSNGKATLSSLLIARFEWAVWTSFFEFGHHDARIPPSSHVSFSTYADEVQKPLLSILGDVLSNCDMIIASMTIDSTTLSRFVAPFVDACHLKDVVDLQDFDSNQIERVILTPLNWILNASKHGVSLDDLDVAVDASLSRMKNHGSENVETKASTKLMSPECCNRDERKSTSSPRKKKKKSKKKKKKRGLAESPVIANDLDQFAALAIDDVRSSPDETDLTLETDEFHVLVAGGIDCVASNLEPSEEADTAETLAICALGEHVTLPETVVDEDETEDETDTQDDNLESLVPVRTSPVVYTDTAIQNHVIIEDADSSKFDGDSWETVEVRGRGNRKKPVERHFHSSPRHPTHFSSGPHDAKKLKSTRAVLTPKKKGTSRKIVREILFSLVDSIDEESRKRKQALSTPPRALNPWKNGPPGARQHSEALLGKDFASAQPSRGESSISDIVVGSITSLRPSHVPSLEDLSMQTPETSQTPKSQISRKEDDSVAGKHNNRRGKSYAGALADQNTAPTYQETISASSHARHESKEDPPNSEDRKSDSSSLADTTEEVPLIREREIQMKLDATAATSPPLPTLLSPENANSATSSVASSLEAPHAGRIHHHSVPASGANDVGYHLLDVCDRLSRDMSLFMSRRALALSARRRERGAILSALQDSVSSIWPRQCHVELYGSCATQLDLPSSDIDVVVLGLDRSDALYSAGSDSIVSNLSVDDNSLNDEGRHQQHFSLPMFGMVPRNAERILRLAADLEGQAWAVQVNAIPTASVPVVKILADPSKLTSNGGEWMAQHQHLAAQVAAAAGKCQSVGGQEFSNAERNVYPHPTHLPWRGSDVMKGLFSLDITFEGPEHGGIGSTEFSSRIVMDACAESGLHPDSTPFVQVLMVLKELLCQRKLNEPYSGGLSSYALLLLVLALVRERAVIREEIELVEQQKRAMALADPSAFGADICNFGEPHDGISYTNDVPPLLTCVDLAPRHFDVNETKVSPNKCDKMKPGSRVEGEHEYFRKSANPPQMSWVSVAKTNVEPKTTNHSYIEERAIEHERVEMVKTDKKPSFADALTRSTNGAGSFGSGRTSLLPDTSTNEQDRGVAVHCSWNAGADLADETSIPTQLVPPSVSAVTTNTPNPSAKSASHCFVAEVSPMENSSLRIAPPFYPQGYNDIVEVLCSGEPTAGKLLMHFLLFYGQHFDAQSTAIDVSGKHERDFTGHTVPFSYMSPFIQRRARGNIDPITGMLTVDPIIIYDPLEGAESNNVARRCFAWNSVRWIFAQSYATLASAVERSATPPSSPGASSVPVSPSREGRDREAMLAAFVPEAMGDLSDPTSPLLKCLLSF